MWRLWQISAIPTYDLRLIFILPWDPVGNRLLAWKTLPWVESKASHPLSDAPMKCARIMDQDCIININNLSTNIQYSRKRTICSPMKDNPLAIFASTTIILAAHSMDKVCLVTTPPWSPAVRGASSPRYLGGSLHPRNTLLSTQTSRPQEYNYSQSLLCARLVDLARTASVGWPRL